MTDQTVKTLIPAGIIWFLNLVATQPIGAPASMGYAIDIPEGERGLFLGGRTGLDNYGAARTVNIGLQLGAAHKGFYSLGTDSVDNQPVILAPSLVSITEVAMTIGTLGIPFMPYILPSQTRIQVTGASLANAETLTGVFLIATRAFPPTVTIIGTGVTMTTEEITQV